MMPPQIILLTRSWTRPDFLGILTMCLCSMLSHLEPKGELRTYSLSDVVGHWLMASLARAHASFILAIWFILCDTLAIWLCSVT